MSRLIALLFATAVLTEAFHIAPARPHAFPSRTRGIVSVASWYDSGTRLTPNGGSFDTTEVPADEERWGGVRAHANATPHG